MVVARTTQPGKQLTFPCRPPDPPSDHNVLELRLALVCYGGVSLAIYMHGITKELEKLARASARFVAAEDGAANPFARELTEHAYFNALRRKAERDGYRTRVVIDIISGTSAGGINGVCLAKAVAQDAPQDSLRDLWLTKGAIRKLVGRPLPVPLAGNKMLRWLGSAFEQMDTHSQGSLMPAGLLLNLFVTTTDIHGYNRTIPIKGPPAITTVVNKHVFEFVNRDDAGNLDQPHNPAIAFSARATSSFPGAFPATHIGDIEPRAARDAFPGEFCRLYELAGSPVEATYFIDGGVLDNFPFRHAVRAIPGKPAATQVDRKLLFIEPDPGGPQQPPAGRSPGALTAVWAGLSKLPRRQPIADALDELMVYNRRVRRLKQMIGTLRQKVYETVLPLLASDYRSANTAANTGAIESNAFTFQSYLRLKLLSVVEGMATSVSHLSRYPLTSTQALFVREALLTWARSVELIETKGDLSDDQRAFLGTFDLGYGRRRLTFVIGRVNDFYDARQDREALNRLKHRMYELLCELQTVLDRHEAAFLNEWVDRIFNPHRLAPYFMDWRVTDFVTDSTGDLSELRGVLGEYLDDALEGFGEKAYAELERFTEDFPPDVRDDLRAHYLGFPYWDAATYPARALSEVVELDEVEVVRVSPKDSTRLTPPDDGGLSKLARRFFDWILRKHSAPKGKLRGVTLAHFGAFFFRSWRENDYLWGRLDGAERLLWLIGEDNDQAEREAFGAIVNDEKGSLRKAKRLIRRVEDYLGT